MARWHGEPTMISKGRSKWKWYTRGTHLYYSFDKVSSISISRMQGRGIHVKEPGFIFALITNRGIGSMLLENAEFKWLQPIGRSLPSDLGSLSSLERLDLSRNGFITVPGSLKRLIVEQHCKSLQSLPEPPSSIQDLWATHPWKPFHIHQVHMHWTSRATLWKLFYGEFGLLHQYRNPELQMSILPFPGCSIIKCSRVLRILKTYFNMVLNNWRNPTK